VRLLAVRGGGVNDTELQAEDGVLSAHVGVPVPPSVIVSLNNVRVSALYLSAEFALFVEFDVALEVAWYVNVSTLLAVLVRVSVLTVSSA
jgi:hypothetical protein